MTHKHIFALVLLIMLHSCQSREYRLKELVDVEAIDSITIHNNAGDYRLSNAELHSFKRILSDMQYHPEASLKMGSIGFSAYLQGKKYSIAGRTHGNYIELPRDMVSKNQQVMPVKPHLVYQGLIFEFDKRVNLDNYRRPR